MYQYYLGGCGIPKLSVLLPPVTEEMHILSEVVSHLHQANERKHIMEAQEIFLTNDGLQRAMSQLEFLRTVKRAEVAQYLHDAKESGDVIDNAAYEEAKSQHANLESRISELEQMLAHARLIDEVRSDEVSLGSLVRLQTSSGRDYCYKLVGAFEADPGAGRISNESPVGRALLGHKPGDLVIVSTPGGVKEYTIISIE
jgi:transcription elongation factor GreA